MSLAPAARKKIAQIAEELAALYKRHGALDPAVVVRWARAHPASALHARFQWDDSLAAEQYRLIQARNLITEVEVVYADGKTRQVYVSPMRSRGDGGYVSLVEVMNDRQRREAFLAQALAEYKRVGERYADLVELAGVRAAVTKATRAARSGAAKKARRA